MTSMNSSDGVVKTSRRYDSSRRRDQARRSRLAVIDAARDQFLRAGYASTTLTAIAAQAGVSVELIYKTFETKTGLLRAVREAALGGQGEVPAEQRSDAVLDSETDARVILTKWAELACEVGPRVAPILLLVQDAAAADPELVPLDRELDDARLARTSFLAAELERRGHLGEGQTVERTRDVLFTYNSPELFHVLVQKLGWPLEEYGQFIAGGMIAAICDKQ